MLFCHLSGIVEAQRVTDNSLLILHNSSNLNLLLLTKQLKKQQCNNCYQNLTYNIQLLFYLLNTIIVFEESRNEKSETVYWFET